MRVDFIAQRERTRQRHAKGADECRRMAQHGQGRDMRLAGRAPERRPCPVGAGQNKAIRRIGAQEQLEQTRQSGGTDLCVWEDVREGRIVAKGAGQCCRNLRPSAFILNGFDQARHAMLSPAHQS